MVHLMDTKQDWMGNVIGILRAQMTAGHEDQEGEGCFRKEFGRTLRSVLARESQEQFTCPQQSL
eukprot:12890876-Prorocentrum_lima.AAC.1